MCGVIPEGSNVCICWTGSQDRWMREWVEFGMRELEAYLLKHDQFDAYYRRTRGAVAA